MIYYNYDTPLDYESIIKKVIEELYDAGYIVVGVTSDQGSTNASIWKHLDVGVEKGQNCYFYHPRDENLNVFVFADDVSSR